MPNAQVLAARAVKSVSMADLFRRSVVWMRRDLRLIDNTALFYAAQRSESIVCAFVLDPALLRGGSFGAPIVSLFFDSLERLSATLQHSESDLALLEGDPARELGDLCERVGAEALFYNEDYEPLAIERDARVAAHLRERKVYAEAFTDHVYAGPKEVVQDDGSPFTEFAPYKRKWLSRMEFSRKLPLPSERVIGGRLLDHTEIGTTRALPAPEEFGFSASDDYPGAGEDMARMLLRAFLESGGPAENYQEARNYPSLEGSSHLSTHLRAGTIGIRTCLNEALAAKLGRSRDAQASIDAWISELIWRDYCAYNLAHFPRAQNGDAKGLGPSEAFERWCEARTGFPIVDAAMTQLNRYGWMHGALRKLCATFLCKTLQVDYRLGERYFETHLADADLASNGAGWYLANSNEDAPADPVEQSKKLDRDGRFIRKMLPILKAVPNAFIHEPWMMSEVAAKASGCTIPRDYPAPIVPAGNVKT